LKEGEREGEVEPELEVELDLAAVAYWERNRILGDQSRTEVDRRGRRRG